jgi:type II secretory pathway component PulC
MSAESIVEQTQAIVNKSSSAYLGCVIATILIILSLLPLWSHNPTHDNVSAPASYSNSNQSMIALDQLHFYGIYTASNAIPISNLDLKLVGTVASQDTTDAYALISDQSGTTKSYQVGDALPGGAILNKIADDRVIINDAGRDEVIILPKPQLNQ